MTKEDLSNLNLETVIEGIYVNAESLLQVNDFTSPVISQEAVLKIVTPDLRQRITAAGVEDMRSTAHLESEKARFQARDKIIFKIFGEDVYEDIDTLTPQGRNVKKARRAVLTTIIAATQQSTENDITVVFNGTGERGIGLADNILKHVAKSAAFKDKSDPEWDKIRNRAVISVAKENLISALKIVLRL